MRFLVECGANCDWVEQDGTSVNKDDIFDWCDMTYEECKAQLPYKEPYCKSSWYNYTFPLYHDIEKGRCAIFIQHIVFRLVTLHWSVLIWTRFVQDDDAYTAIFFTFLEGDE